MVDLPFPTDIYTEPEPSADTLANLGPLRALAGTWEGSGLDVHPVVTGAETDPYLERLVFEPIDAQTNGPQLLYGLRYHHSVIRVSTDETFHDQIGYLLWEPLTGTVTMTLAIPRGQVAMATGHAAADDRSFTVRAAAGSTSNGILSNPFLDHAFHTSAWEATFRATETGRLSYEQHTTLHPLGSIEPFDHVDTGTLERVAEPKPNRAALQ